MENDKPKFSRKPNHEFKAQVSGDGKWWIFKSTETWVIPRNYIDTIDKNKTLTPAPEAETLPRKTKTKGSDNVKPT